MTDIGCFSQLEIDFLQTDGAAFEPARSGDESDRANLRFLISFLYAGPVPEARCTRCMQSGSRRNFGENSERFWHTQIYPDLRW